MRGISCFYFRHKSSDTSLSSSSSRSRCGISNTGIAELIWFPIRFNTRSRYISVSPRHRTSTTRLKLKSSTLSDFRSSLPGLTILLAERLRTSRLCSYECPKGLISPRLLFPKSSCLSDGRRSTVTSPIALADKSMVEISGSCHPAIPSTELIWLLRSSSFSSLGSLKFGRPPAIKLFDKSISTISGNSLAPSLLISLILLSWSSRSYRSGKLMVGSSPEILLKLPRSLLSLGSWLLQMLSRF